MLVRNFHGFQQLLDLRNPLDLCLLHFSGMKNVAFFFSAIATQRLKKQRCKQKANEDHEDSDDTEECEEFSQVAGSSSQDWLANHASIINEKMCPSVSY